MPLQFDNVKESQNLIKKLMLSIVETTQSMNHTFEETVLRHEEQFIKCYRLKITELVKLLQEMKSTIEDNFINNTLAIQLETVLKERDYFKYECLKLNSQHQSLIDDHKNLNAQATNSSQQITIYKHLLETEKIKSNQIENNIQDLKKSLADIAIRSMPEVKNHHNNRAPQFEKEMVRVKKDLREKNEVVRALREKAQELERAANLQHGERVERKQFYELWRVCVDGWRREAQSKCRKEESKVLTLQKMSILNKKQLLRLFFSHGEFLKFIQRLIFDHGFMVTFESTDQNYMERNRAKLVNYMNKKRIYTSQSGRRM